jgi:hypothetical protein
MAPVRSGCSRHEAVIKWRVASCQAICSSYNVEFKWRWRRKRYYLHGDELWAFQNKTLAGRSGMICGRRLQQWHSRSS